VSSPVQPTSTTPAADSVDATRLYVALGRISRAVRRDASVGQVGHGALSVLATLTADGPQRLGALALLEGVSPPSMTRTIAALEDLGHVRRTTDPDDGRVCIVVATETGRDLVVAGRAEKLAALAVRIDRLEPAARRALGAAVAALEELSQEE
jgi:DNA-binding MarR family transcriptional regulator